MEQIRQKSIRLLKQSRQGLVRLLFSRTGVITAVLLVQIGLMVAFFWGFEQFLPHFFGVYLLFSGFMVLYLFSTDCEPTVKLTWLVVIMMVPVAGSMFYLFTKSEAGHRLLGRRYAQRITRTRSALGQDDGALEELARQEPEVLLEAQKHHFGGTQFTSITNSVLHEKPIPSQVHQ